jgi:hypothetical protein
MLVGPYMAPIAANHPCHRPADRKSASRLGKCEALLGEHAVRFEVAWSSSASNLLHAQSHDLLRLLTETRRREREFHPRSEHGGFRLAACSYDNAEQEADAQCDC